MAQLVVSADFASMDAGLVHNIMKKITNVNDKPRDARWRDLIN